MRRLPRRRAGRAALPLLALILLGLSARPGHAASDPAAALSSARGAFAAARAQQWRDHILAPLRAPDGRPQTAGAPALPQLQPVAQAELRQADAIALLAADATLDNWMPSLAYRYRYPDHADPAATLFGDGRRDWPALLIEQGPPDASAAASQPPLPDWVAPAVRARLAALDQAAADHAAPHLGATRLLWDGQVDATAGDALVWSGPAVKHGVAHYRSVGDHTVLRLSSAAAHLDDLYRWAQRHGTALHFTLDGDAPLALDRPVPVRVSLRLPVWLVTPQALLPATLTALRGGGPCLGGDWIELELPGQQQPAVWATLFLPDAATAAAASVRRLPPEPPGPGSAATTVSRVELSWPDHRLTPLLLTAKQFGTVWGTQADVLVDDHGQPSARRLSGSGTPACGL